MDGSLVAQVHTAGVFRAEWTQGASAEKFAKTLQRLWWYQRHVERAVGLTAHGPELTRASIRASARCMKGVNPMGRYEPLSVRSS